VSGLVVVVSSPSGGGKTTIVNDLVAARSDVGISVSATTRAPRAGEQDGVQYHFLATEEFVRRREAGEFLEWAEYSGHLYGTPASEVDRLLAGGLHALLDIEVEGARQLRERRSDVVSIFVLPPSADVLLDRLRGRASDSPEEVDRRLAHADWELEQATSYDYIVVNDDRAEAVARVAAILDAEAGRTDRQPDLDVKLRTLRQALAAQRRT
jgi:guanylate kinase